jgi:3-deoxy-D-manno-octulosonic-acid transferase
MHLSALAWRGLYNLLLYLCIPLIIARLLKRGCRTPAYLQRWGERLGFAPNLAGQPLIWVHAVSVGEVRASLPLVRLLLSCYPQHTLLLTTTTPTGSAQVQTNLDGQVAHCYLPYDFPDAIARFLQRTQPQFGVILETELWPNLLYQCHRRGIPVLLASARLSERSARGYTRLRRFTHEILTHLTFIAAQGKADAERFIALGAPPERVHVVGNLKFDFTPPSHLASEGMILRKQWGEQRPLWIAASTHAGEEEQILAAFRRVQQFCPNTLLVLVPRHPERFSRVHHLCQYQGFSTQLRSEYRPCEPSTEVLLGNTMGELPVFFAAADVAFIGGSLVPVGGHNPLEPAALEKAVIWGPHMFNFAEISQSLLAAGAAAQVTTISELADTVLRYLQDPQLRVRAGKAGLQVVAQNRGGAQRILRLIQKMISESKQKKF